MKIRNTESTWSHTYFKPLMIISICGGCFRPLQTNKIKLICFLLFFIFIAVPPQIMSFWKAVGCLTDVEPELRNRNLGLYITYLGLGLSCAIPSLLGLVYFPKKLSKVLETYDRLRIDPLFEIHLNRSRTFMKIYFSISFFLTAVLSILLIFGTAPFTTANCLTAPLMFHNNPILLWVSICLIPLHCAMVILQRFAAYGFIGFLTNIVMKEFARLNMEFEKLLTSTVTVHRLEIIRKRYFDICDFVTEIDDVLMPFVSVYLMYSLTTICLDIHSLLYGFLSHIQIICYCVIVGISTSEVVIIMVNGSLIASRSKCCVEISQRFNMNKLNTETMSAFTLFLENMKSTDVGLSFLKLFIVDKTAMMTITGTLISYLVVVLQMKPTSTD